MAAAKKKTAKKPAKKPARTKLKAEATRIITPARAASDASKIKQLTLPETDPKPKNGKPQKPPAGYGSWRNPRTRSDGSQVYSTTIHLPMPLSQRIDEVRMATRLRINEIVCEALDLWLTAQRK